MKKNSMSKRLGLKFILFISQNYLTLTRKKSCQSEMTLRDECEECEIIFEAQLQQKHHPPNHNNLLITEQNSDNSYKYHVNHYPTQGYD